ncbi:hypothetical protein AVEN_217171-1 [Araneus ventricosus]|uniref:Uncharacterized protein n=1 Tax=Araneus ventricosus TaxID=182803 RepID=A0A4Y2SD88_ARAVE|nr:hypothetical protein AVEN_121525-1 [Araneus ventricosus]GBN85529.1 hypothetical protein AVEN_217171-1 [Araneus ventricosus]
MTIRLPARQSRLLNSIQRKFLLNITGAYSTTPTAALQVIEGIIPLHFKAEQEAAFVRKARLRKHIITTTSTSTPITIRTTQHPPNSTHQFFKYNTESL